MALLSFLAFKNKWAALTGRFRDNSNFEIDEADYREFSLDLADTVVDPLGKLQLRVDKLENPAPQPKVGVKWRISPKVSIDPATKNVLNTAAEAEFDGVIVPFAAGTAKSAVPAPPVGFGTRVDILAATSTGWAYIFGEEPGVTPRFVLPDQPNVDLLFAAYLFWTSEGGEVETPIVYIRTVDGQDPDPSGNLTLSIAKYTAYTTTSPIEDTDIGASQKISGTKYKWTFIGLYNWIKAKLDSVYAASTHSHNASDINAGTLANARLSTDVPLKSVSNTFAKPQVHQADTATGVPATSQNTVSNATGNLHEFRRGLLLEANVEADGTGNFKGFKKAGSIKFVDILNVNDAHLQRLDDIPPTEITKMTVGTNWTGNRYTGTPLVNCNMGARQTITIETVDYRVEIMEDNAAFRTT